MSDWTKLALIVGMFALVTAARLFAKDEESVLSDMMTAAIPD